MKKLLGVLAVSTLLWSAGCRTMSANGITQVATIDALLAGVYDGHMSLADLRRHGDLGIGTFAGLDGEMILLDGRFYQVRADGLVYRPELTTYTPFACVTRFVPNHFIALRAATDTKALEQRIDEVVPEPNRVVAIRLRGEFSRMRTRSVPAQKKPYPPLAAVTPTQPVFELGKVRGTLVGFRAPPFVKGVNVPGYHLHFLAEGRSAGGHVLDFELIDGVLELDTLHDWMTIHLPAPGGAFDTADLHKDRARELERVEK